MIRRGRTVAARRLAIVLLAAVVPVLVACNSGDDGTNGSATTTAAVKLWDPCTQIPDDVLRKTGVDPATKESGIAGVHQSGWEICSWKSPKYYLNVLSTGRSVQEFETKEGNVDFRDVTIAGRQGREFRVAGASKDTTCNVVFPAQQGAVQLKVMNNLVLDSPENPCNLLQDAGEFLVPVLPK
ncbi:DUF3558 domain-containing protein [Nocardia nova]|uniref:DUF3558 domain-containing protein n=1 Tax=Nocardia nova TaxID=37330 RepID=A0A2S6AWW2_9NOCA|nr:DUF3558 domain-containing protein [Nocardia nova]